VLGGPLHHGACSSPISSTGPMLTHCSSPIPCSTRLHPSLLPLALPISRPLALLPPPTCAFFPPGRRHKCTRCWRSGSGCPHPPPPCPSSPCPPWRLLRGLGGASAGWSAFALRSWGTVWLWWPVQRPTCWRWSRWGLLRSSMPCLAGAHHPTYPCTYPHTQWRPSPCHPPNTHTTMS
jgi:hypothetical protein